MKTFLIVCICLLLAPFLLSAGCLMTPGLLTMPWWQYPQHTEATPADNRPSSLLPHDQHGGPGEPGWNCYVANGCSSAQAVAEDRARYGIR